MMNGRPCVAHALWVLLLFATTGRAATAADACAGSGAVPSNRYDVQASAPGAAFGSKLEVVITPPAQNVSAICFDSLPAANPEIVKSAEAARIRVAIPAPDASATRKPLPAGSYPVRIVLAPDPPSTESLLLEGAVAVPLVLRAIRSHPFVSSEGTFSISLFGSGFDTLTPSNNLLLVNGEPRDVCWTDAECNARHSRLRGSVATPQELVVSGIDPREERTAEFRVRVGLLSSGPVMDQDANRRWVAVVTVSALLTLALIGAIVLLASGMRKQTVRGEDYVIRLLFLDKETNTYSLSKLQFYLWTIAGVFGYIYLAISRNYFQQVYGLPPIPAGLPGIIGIAAGTSVAAQVVTAINGPKGAGQTKPSISDFLTTGDVVAAERVQFLVWTLLGVAGFVIFTARLDPRTLQDLPDIPATLLTISGISAFGYLGGKLARDPGPVINEGIMTVGPDPDAPQAAGNYGLIELRGRTLSRDAMFRIDNVDLSFNKLRGQKPVVIERDSDSKQETMAKRLRLMVILDAETSPLFMPRSEHTVAITNPDSQRAVLQLTVPESQKPS
ncbi:MAG TPA: hypothetical protein VF767_08915 [Bryobacteraceae bacterium]